MGENHDPPWCFCTREKIDALKHSAFSNREGSRSGRGCSGSLRKQIGKGSHHQGQPRNSPLKQIMRQMLAWFSESGPVPSIS